MTHPLFKFTGLFVLLLLLAACGSSSTEGGPAEAPTTPPTTAPTDAPTAAPEVEAPASELPPAVSYNLGDATLVQANFPEDSRFRNMPVRLNGIIATPAGDDGPYPVVVIIHGTHPGCPEDEMHVDRWPCDPELEQANYQGFDYLVRHLAGQGYVALSINANAENTFGFAEPAPGERLGQLVPLHLSALAAAANGGPNKFGLPLAGVADMQQLVFVGHSRGGEAGVWFAENKGWAAPDAFEQFGFGPIVGLLLLAPAPTFLEPSAPSVPLAVILPSCDGDVTGQEGQLFYEAARFNPEAAQWATSVWLEQGNHNQFNEILGPDLIGSAGRSDCDTLLTPEAQREFMKMYATDFLTAVLHNDPAAKERLGLNVAAHPPDSLYGLPAQAAVITPADNKLRLFWPAAEAELTTHLAGGAVTAENVTTFFCEAGHFTPTVKPGSEPCKRVNLTIPGNPAMLVLSWEQPGGALRFALPEAVADLHEFTAVSLRTAVDPTSPLNAPGQPQAFTMQLTDRTGAAATAQTRPAEPALRFPPGNVEEGEDFFAGGLFTGRVPMTQVRLLLADFAGVDLTQISEIAILFDQTASGSLFMGDIELVKP